MRDIVRMRAISRTMLCNSMRFRGHIILRLWFSNLTWHHFPSWKFVVWIPRLLAVPLICCQHFTEMSPLHGFPIEQNSIFDIIYTQMTKSDSQIKYLKIMTGKNAINLNVEGTWNGLKGSYLRGAVRKKVRGDMM